jgi:hypothetical protein
MNYLKIYIKQVIIVIICVALFAPKQANAQDKKTILEKKISINAAVVLLDPWYDFLDAFKLTSRVQLGADYKLNTKTAAGARLMYQKFKTYPQDVFSEGDPYTQIYQLDTVIPLTKAGYTKSLGAELYVKRFRAKKHSFFPAGNFFEYGLGFHKTTFTGYHYTAYEYLNGSYAFSDIREPERVVKTVSLSFGTGKQWIYDNNMFLGYGLTFRGNIPISGLSSETYGQDGVSATSLYLQEILGTDWFSTFVHVGYLF